MFLLGHCAGYGRGFWMSFDNDTVEIRSRSERLRVTVKDGIVVEQTRIDNKQRSTLRYGEYHKLVKNGRTVDQEYYCRGTLRAIRRGGLYRRQKDVSLCGSKGTIERYSTASGAHSKEIFTYNNGVQAYTATRWRKKLIVKRPDGKLWMIIQGKVHLPGYSSVAEIIESRDDDDNLASIMRNNDWSVTVYGKDGATIITQGQVRNRQKQDKWLENRRVKYYLSGIAVSREIYEDSPDKWDANEILRLPNAQLRCSLLNRMGYDKLAEKVKCKVIENSDDGGQLLEVDTHTSGSQWALDRMMRMVKVICPSTGQVYVLRVPPEIKSYEKARQWTFGLRRENLDQGACLQLIKET